MKTIDSALQSHFSARLPFSTHDFLWIIATSGETYGFWSGEYDRTVSVDDVETGAPVSRAFIGGGQIVNIPDIQDQPDLEIRSISIGLSAVSADILNMVNGDDLRGAAIQWNRGFCAIGSSDFIAPPMTMFDGFINGISLSEPGIDLASSDGVEPVYTLVCDSHLQTLTKTSARTRSYQHGKERSGDEIFKYASSVGRVKIRWGSGKMSHDDKAGRGGSKNDLGTRPESGR